MDKLSSDNLLNRITVSSRTSRSRHANVAYAREWDTRYFFKLRNGRMVDRNMHPAQVERELEQYRRQGRIVQQWEA